MIARLIAEQMGQRHRSTLRDRERGGRRQLSTAMTRAARAPNDGYTIIIGNSGTATAVYALYPDLKFTPDDFAPIGIVAKTSPVIALKKDQPGQDAERVHRLRQEEPWQGHARPCRRQLLELPDLQGLSLQAAQYRRHAGELPRRRPCPERTCSRARSTASATTRAPPSRPRSRAA